MHFLVKERLYQKHFRWGVHNLHFTGRRNYLIRMSVQETVVQLSEEIKLGKDMHDEEEKFLSLVRNIFFAVNGPLFFLFFFSSCKKMASKKFELHLLMFSSKENV